MAAPAVATSPRTGWAIGLALALLAVVAFANALEGEFLYDDFPYIVDNPQVQEPTARRIFLEPFSGRAELGLYRPLPLLSYALQARGRGADAATLPFHLFNVLVHAAVTLLVWRLGLRIGLGAGAAALGAALFAVHPCHVEPVDWIVGRAELLAAAFGLGFLVVALGRPQSKGSSSGCGRTVAAAALLLAAGGSKESAFALPIVLVVIEAALGRIDGLRTLLRRHAPWVVVLLGLAALRIAALSVAGADGTVELRFGPDAGLAPFTDVPWYARPLLAAQLLGEYFRRALLPTPPRIFFHRAEFTELAPLAVAGFVAWAAALVLTRRRPALRALLLAFPISLLTVLNLRPIQETFAERFLYLPSAFVTLFAAVLLAALVRRERERTGRVGLSLLPAGAALLALLAATWAWNPIFDSPLALWRHNVARAPELPFPHYQLAYFLHDEGLFTRRDADHPGAVEEYETALEKNEAIVAQGFEGMPPDQRIRAYLALGQIWLEKLPEGRRDPKRARPWLERAIQLGVQKNGLDRELGNAYWYYALLARFESTGITTEQAIAALESALQLELREETRAAIRAELERLRGR